MSPDEILCKLTEGMNVKHFERNYAPGLFREVRMKNRKKANGIGINLISTNGKHGPIVKKKSFSVQ